MQKGSTNNKMKMLTDKRENSGSESWVRIHFTGVIPGKVSPFSLLSEEPLQAVCFTLLFASPRAHSCTHIHVYTHTCVHTHMCTHTYAHTFPCSQSLDFRLGALPSCGQEKDPLLLIAEDDYQLVSLSRL